MPKTFTLEKFNPSDDYPLCPDTELSGGYRVLVDITERDAIVISQRKEGMLVFVQSDLHYYQLVGGITNLDWVDLGDSLGGGSSNRIPSVDASNASPYNPSILTEDMYIACDTSGGTVDVTISIEDVADATPSERRIFIIMDEGGNASVNRIRVRLESNNPGVSGLINGQDYKDIILDWNSITLNIDGINGFIY